MKLNINIPAEFMKKVGLREIQLVKEDAAQGKTQSPTASNTSPYRSREYVKYKANYMNRFTDKTGSKGSKYKSIFWNLCSQ